MATRIFEIRSEKRGYGGLIATQGESLPVDKFATNATVLVWAGPWRGRIGRFTLFKDDLEGFCKELEEMIVNGEGTATYETYLPSIQLVVELYGPPNKIR